MRSVRDGVGRVSRMDTAFCAARQVPEHPGVHGFEQQFSGLGADSRALDVVEDPRDLGPGKVGRERQSDPYAIAVVVAVREPIHDVLRPGVLPDDGVADRSPRGPVPDDGRLALVGDADRGDAAGAAGVGPASPERWLPITSRVFPPDLGGVVLDPARPAGNAACVRAGRLRRPPPCGRRSSPVPARSLIHGEDV